MRYTQVICDRLDNEAVKLPYTSKICERVNHLIAHAWDNAPGDPQGQIDSLISLLSYETDKRVIRWFAKRGITA